LFFTTLARFREQQGLGARKHKFRFKNKLLSSGVDHHLAPLNDVSVGQVPVFGRWSMAGVFFVTRLKENAAFEVIRNDYVRHRNGPSKTG
jgi:hypothetical protein